MKIFKTIFIFIDLVSILITFLILDNNSIFKLFPVIIFWLLLNYLFNKYKLLGNKLKESFKEIFFFGVISNLIFILFIKLAYLFISNNQIYDYLNLYKFFILSSVLSIFTRFIFEIIKINFVNKSKIFFIINNTNLNFSYDYNFFDSENNKLRFIEFADDIYQYKKNSKTNNFCLIVNEKHLTKNEITKLKKNNVQIINIFEWLEKNKFILIPENTTINDLNLETNYIEYFYRNHIKRSIDYLFSLIILLIASPIIIISCILIFIEDGGSIIYSQKRSGYKNKCIKIYKLRTMSINSEINGAKWAEANDKRITKIGKFLRLTRIDELPQLINVLKGEMSLIGPRPERPEIDINLEKKIINYNMRYLARPGVSGWAQVNYPYASSIRDTYNKLSYDLFYIRNQNFFLDIYIFIRTIKVILNVKGSKPKS